MKHLALVMFLCACAAYGQHRGQLSGVVRDPSESVVGGASISALNLDNGTRRTATSDEEGFYAISSLAPGNYKVTVRKQGFRTLAQHGIKLNATEAARLDFGLQLGSLQETVTVESQTPFINSEDATVGVVISRSRSSDLPLNGRGIQGLLDLAPGVLATPATQGEAGQFTANGHRPNQNYFTVDGVSANNGIIGSGLPGQFAGGALPAMTAIGSLHTLASLGEVEEVRVQTSTFAPEFGRLPGAQIGVTTRSGSNEFHADVSGAFRHEALTATDVFASRRDLSEGSQRFNNASGSAGGPVIRDRTFFFASAERLGLRQTATWDSVVPSRVARLAAEGLGGQLLGLYPEANGDEINRFLARHTYQGTSAGSLAGGSLRVDHALNGSSNLFGRYSETRSDSVSGGINRNNVEFTSRSFTGGIISAISPAITNDARLNISNTSVRSAWNASRLPGLLPLAEAEQRLYAVFIQGLDQLTGGDAGASRQRQWNIIDTLSISTGRHSIRLGADHQRLTPRRERTISSVAVTYDDISQVVSGRAPSYAYARADSGSSLLETFSLFAQDTWRVTPRLSVTYGLRWELTPPPAYRPDAVPQAGGPESGFVPNPSFTADLAEQGLQAAPAWRTRYNQFAPRVGVALRLNNEGTLVLRAGAGLFYDLGFSSATDLINGAPYNRWRSLNAPAIGSIEVVYGFAKDLKLPRSYQWNVTLEKAFGPDTALAIGYSSSAGRELLRREGNLTGAPRLVVATNNGRSDYHAGTIQYRSRLRQGLRGALSYTWAHAIDNGSWDSASFAVFTQRPDLDRGSSNFDVRHSAQAAISYDLPAVTPVLKHWTLSGILRARTGFPIDVVSQENAFGFGFDNTYRPDLIPGVPVWVGEGKDRRLNRDAFVGRSGPGNLGRNAIRGHGLAQTDLALQRRILVGETSAIDIRLETYNVFNQTNLSDPVRYLSSPLFGQSVSSANLMLGSGRPHSGLNPLLQPGGPRSFQVAVAFRF